MANLPLPACPCPICGQAHSHFITGSSHSPRGAGRGSLTRPHRPYTMHMTDDEIESAIYGPLTRSLNPNCPCRVVSYHEAAAAHGLPIADVGMVRAGHRPMVPAQLAGFGEGSGFANLIKYAIIAFVAYKAIGMLTKATDEQKTSPIQAR